MTRLLLGVVAVAAIVLSYALLFLWRRRGDAHQDLVTGLANRDFFERYLQYCAARAARAGERYRFAVLLINLDGLDALRRSMGRMIVDEIVADFAERVFWVVRPSDAMARIGPDAFGVVIDDCREVADAARVAMRVHASLREAVTLSGRHIPLSISMGITMNRVDAVRDAPELIADAESALAASRASERPYAVFGDDLDVAARQWLALEQVVVDGRVGDELAVHFAPAVDPQTFLVRGFSTAFVWTLGKPTGLDVAMVERVLAHSHAGPHLVHAAIAEACALLAAGRGISGAQPFVEVRLGALATRPVPILRVVEEQLIAHGITGKGLRLAVPAEVLADADQPFRRVLPELEALGVGLHVEIGPASAVPLQRLAAIRPAGARVDITASHTADRSVREAHAHLVRSYFAIAPEVIVFGVQEAADVVWVRSLELGAMAQGTFVSAALDAAGAAQLATAGRLRSLAGSQSAELQSPAPPAD